MYSIHYEFVSGFLWFPPPIKLTTTTLIGKMVESGIKPHKPNIPLYKSAYPNDQDA
jgi:hypothetical protein